MVYDEIAGNLLRSVFRSIIAHGEKTRFILSWARNCSLAENSLNFVKLRTMAAYALFSKESSSIKYVGRPKATIRFSRSIQLIIRDSEPGTILSSPPISFTYLPLAAMHPEAKFPQIPRFFSWKIILIGPFQLRDDWHHSSIINLVQSVLLSSQISISTSSIPAVFKESRVSSIVFS